MKQRVLVWDLPVRGFHLLFAGGFTAAYVIAKFLGEDAPSFPYHSIIGLTLGLLVVLRGVWGLVGTRWARFSGLALDPRALLSYMASVVSGQGRRYVGHNPATSVTLLLMFAAVLGLAWTGIQIRQGNKGLKDIHELLANGMLVLVGMHVLGVVVHTIRHRDGIVMGMVDGRKAGDAADAIRGPALPAALVGAILVGFVFGSLLSNFDPVAQTTRIPVAGTQLRLGEAEGNEGGERGEMEEDED
jgi:cytochrome b